MLQTTYTNARANFAGLCNEVAENREIVLIRRRKGNDVAIIAADELQSLVESAHLMRTDSFCSGTCSEGGRDDFFDGIASF
jgi:antitoxin YefM